MSGQGNLAAKVALRRAYDLDNTIYTEAVDSKEPFSLIMMHQTEAAANQGKWEELLDRFKIHQIKEYFGFNFTEWVNQPNDLVEKQINASIRWREQELQLNQKTTTELEKGLGNPPNK